MSNINIALHELQKEIIKEIIKGNFVIETHDPRGFDILVENKFKVCIYFDKINYENLKFTNLFLFEFQEIPLLNNASIKKEIAEMLLKKQVDEIKERLKAQKEAVRITQNELNELNYK